MALHEQRAQAILPIKEDTHDDDLRFVRQVKCAVILPGSGGRRGWAAGRQEASRAPAWRNREKALFQFPYNTPRRVWIGEVIADIGADAL